MTTTWDMLGSRFVAANTTSNKLKSGTKYETEFDASSMNSLQEKNKSTSDRADDGLSGTRFAVIYHTMRLDDVSQIRDPGIVDVASSLDGNAIAMTRIILHYGIAAGTADLAIGSKITDITKMSRFYQIDADQADVVYNLGVSSRRGHVARVEMIGVNYGKIVKFQQDAGVNTVESSKPKGKGNPKQKHKKNPKKSVRKTIQTPLKPGEPLDPGRLISHWKDLISVLPSITSYPDSSSELIAATAVKEYDDWPNGKTEKDRETWETVLKYVTDARVISPTAALADKEKWYKANVLPNKWAWSAVFIRWCASNAGSPIPSLKGQGSSHIGYFLKTTKETFKNIESGTIPSDWIYLRGLTPFTSKVKQGLSELNSPALPTYEDIGYHPQIGDIVAGIGGVDSGFHADILTVKGLIGGNTSNAVKPRSAIAIYGILTKNEKAKEMLQEYVNTNNNQGPV